MSQPRNLVIQSEPIDGSTLDLLTLARRCDPEGRRALDRLGVSMPASFSARGGVLFVGYLDGRAVVAGAFAPVGDSLVNGATTLLLAHRSARSIRRAMLDHLEDAAHLAGYRPALGGGSMALPDCWLGHGSATVSGRGSSVSADARA